MRDISEQNAAYNGLRELLQSAEDIFAATLQTIADYAHFLEKEQYEELVTMVHEKLPDIFRNILDCQDRESILSALWLLENRFEVSYEEIFAAVEEDVKHSKMFNCVDYPTQWVSSYYLVKAGYDFFYDRRELLMVLYPKASERIAATFPSMKDEE